MSSSPPVLLITGANTGLGFETVKALCQSPKAYTILLSGRNLDKATAAVQDVRKEFPQSPSTVEAVQIDIEDDESISRAFEHVASQHGRLDVLINNAGPQGGTSLPRMQSADVVYRWRIRPTSPRLENDTARKVE